MASGDVRNQMPNIVLGSYGKENICQVDNRGVLMPTAQRDFQSRHWIPDERDAFISWLRGEFAAANAMIDGMCHHLQMIGKPGEYDFVLTCIQQRRYNWTVVLHMQQYFSVAEVMYALQLVFEKKQGAPSDQSHMQQPQQLYTATEVDGGNLRKEMANGVRDSREAKGGPLIPSFFSSSQHGGAEEGRSTPEAFELPGRSDIESDRRGNGQGAEGRQEVAVSKVDATVHLHRHEACDEAYAGQKHSEVIVRCPQDAVLSSPAAPPAQSFQQEQASAGDSENRGHLEVCINGDLKEGCLPTLVAPEERVSFPDFQFSSKEEEGQRHAMLKTSSYFSCSEAVDGKLINVAEGLELHENVLNLRESACLTVLVNELQAAGRRGRTFMGARRGLKGKGRETIQYGFPHPEALNEIPEPMPAFLQVIIDRLVRWHIIPASSLPDSCTIHILDEGDYLPPHIDHSNIERPFCMLSVLSDCTFVLGHSLTMDAPGDFKGAFHLSLPIGSVLVLQGNSADVSRHAVTSSPSKRISITLGKLLPNKSSRISSQYAGLPHPTTAAPSVCSTSRTPAFNNRQLLNNAVGPTHGGTGHPNPKPHNLVPVSGVLPVPIVRPPTVQAIQSMPTVPTSGMQPLFPAAAGHTSAYPPMAAIPQTQWSTVPRPLPPSRAPSAGTGVFFPCGSVSSGPGRPVTTLQRRHGSLTQPPPLLQKTNSLPASFISPAPSPSPTKTPKSSVSGHLNSCDRHQAERTLTVPPSSSNVGGTAQNLPVAGLVTGNKLADLTPRTEANGSKIVKEVDAVTTPGLPKAVPGGNTTDLVVNGGAHP